MTIIYGCLTNKWPRVSSIDKKLQWNVLKWDEKPQTNKQYNTNFVPEGHEMHTF